MTNILKPIIALLAVALLGSCGGTPVKAPCTVEVYTPVESYSVACLLDDRGRVTDSLAIVNDTIRFTRTDTAAMPYVVTLQLLNPADSLDMVHIPMVIEGGEVTLALGDRIELGGTPDNVKLFRFLKAKNNFSAHYVNETRDVEKLRKDYSEFYSGQIILNADNVVGRYLLDAYGRQLTPADRARVKEKMK